jgi:hypothetical protein
MELKPLENPIVIHPHLLQRFLKQGKNYANLLALYSFYLYHAQQQKTNQPLATDEFTRKGMNWASDRVKKTKKLLKEMGLIEVVQKRKYYYIHLLFIYTKKKLGEILGNCNIFPKPSIKEEVKPSEVKKETKTKSKSSISVMPNVLKKWLEHCDKKGIKYQKSNLTYWEKKLSKRVVLDQQEAIYKAISRGWRDFYLVPKKDSKYHKFLGQSLMMEKDCDTLLNIGFANNHYIYHFKNIKFTTTANPYDLFKRHGYDRGDNKAPIISTVQQKLMRFVQRF